MKRFTFTPRTSRETGERLFLEISADDHDKIKRGPAWRARVTDLNTGIEYIVGGADCGAACYCAAVVIERIAPPVEGGV